MAYFGAAADLGAYLSSMGHPVAPNQNPAEFVLDIVNKDFTDASKVRRLTLLAGIPSCDWDSYPFKCARGSRHATDAPGAFIC